MSEKEFRHAVKFNSKIPNEHIAAMKDLAQWAIDKQRVTPEPLVVTWIGLQAFTGDPVSGDEISLGMKLEILD